MESVICVLGAVLALLALVRDNKRGMLFKTCLICLQMALICGTCFLSVLKIRRANSENITLQKEICRQGGVIDSQNKTIEFMNSIAQIPVGKLHNVEMAVVKFMSQEKGFHYGYLRFDPECEILSFVFTDSTRTKFKGAIFLDRTRIENLIRRQCSQEVTIEVFEELLTASIADGCKDDKEELFNQVTCVIKALVPINGRGLDLKNDRFIYEVPGSNCNWRVVLDATRTRGIASKPQCEASLLLHDILSANGIRVVETIKNLPGSCWFSHGCDDLFPR